MGRKKTTPVAPFNHDAVAIGKMGRRDVTRLITALADALEESMDEPQVEVRQSNYIDGPQIHIALSGRITQGVVHVTHHDEWVSDSAFRERLPEFAPEDLGVIKAALQAAVSEFYAPNADYIWGGFDREDFERVLNTL